MRRIGLLLALLALLGACRPTAVVVTATLNPTPVVIVVTATPSLPTVAPTVALATSTPTPLPDSPTPTRENCYKDCTILANSTLKSPCDNVTVLNRPMILPASWSYVWNPNVQGVADKDLSKKPPIATCAGYGVKFDIANLNGVFGLQTDFSTDKNVKYLIKVEYSAQCNYGADNKTPLTPAVFNVGGEIENSDGSKVTKLPPQSLPTITDKMATAGEALWLVVSPVANPGGVLKIYFTFPFASCKDFSWASINAVYMSAVDWKDNAIQY